MESHTDELLPPPTVSIGAAEMQLGDAALYRAKLNGRNRVEITSGRAARLAA